MSACRITSLLCASFAFAGVAGAQSNEPFVVQLRLPARDTFTDVFAYRTPDGVKVEGSALAALGVNAPNTPDLVALADVPGLNFVEDTHEGAIVLSCTRACYAHQQIDLDTADAPQIADSSASGGYINYDVNVQWVDEEGTSAAGVIESSIFGRWGLVDSSWLAQSENGGRFTRLETTWTIDRPRLGIRGRIGDSIHVGATGTPLRFGGIQIGRYFGLTPSMITYPTPTLEGEAASASTVELYVDGVLRAQSAVEAGPFMIDHPPIVSGGGEAQLVITDLLGRQQTISRPFFVSTQLLRQGLSDWSFAMGAERRDFGLEDARYGETFAAGRYRFGLTNSVTIEGAIEATDHTTTAQAGITGVSALGQIYLSNAENEGGAYNAASYWYDGQVLSIGAQYERRDGDFTPLGRTAGDAFREGLSGNVGIEMGPYGALSLTAANVIYEGEPETRTTTLAYTPAYLDGALSFRLAYFEREEAELAVGVSFNFSFAGDVSAYASIDNDGRGTTYRASAQSAPEPGSVGWRARASLGASERAELATMSRGRLGDTIAEASYAGERAGVRVQHGGSVGWIDGMSFAGRRIEESFALVDAGAPNVSVARNRLDVGQTGADGRRLVSNLRPYADNVISISADDLPIDRAPATPNRRVMPVEGAGVVVRFTDARERITETHVAFANGELPPRGAILVRQRDGERFPVGSEGRIVLQGAQADDVLQLSNTTCSASANEDDALNGLILQCAAQS